MPTAAVRSLLCYHVDMASLSERERNNIRAGVFVTIALLLSMGVVIVLTDAVSALSRATRTAWAKECSARDVSRCRRQ